MAGSARMGFMANASESNENTPTIAMRLPSFIFGSSPGASAVQTQSIVDSNTAFALSLYDELKSRPGNIFFSPFSISTALAIAYAGARGETEKQMGRVLHFGTNQRQVHPTFGELQRRLSEASEKPGIRLNIANALWAQKGHPFRPDFMEISSGNYRANVNSADFLTAAEAARGEINHWVSQQTNDRIQDILPPDSLTDLTRLILANAVYFKGIWAEPFDAGETSSQPFHLLPMRRVQAQLMHHFDNVRYTGENDFQAVELPYQSDELSMVILLPREVDGCAGLERRLTPTLLSRSLIQMKPRPVEIFLPRFRLQSAFDLCAPLAKMGMPNAFGPEADFSGIDGTRQLFISGVFHKAWGEVNEEGTEAAAATAMAVAGCARMTPPPPPPVFRADHPFIFAIRDTRFGSVLILGRLTDPTA